MPLYTLKSLIEDCHHFTCFVAAPDQSCHDLHWKFDMVKKQLEPSAKVIEIFFTVWCLDEAILGAFAVAGKTHITIKTVQR